MSRDDLRWAVEHLDADTAAAAQWLLDHEDFFRTVETARDNDDYLAAGAAAFAGGSAAAGGKLSLADVDSHLTKLDTWATLLPYMATIDVAARGGDHDGVMSREDFEAFLADYELPPHVRQAAQQVLDDGAYHDTGGDLITWSTLLDIASFIPVVGDVLDGAMAIYYLSQGDWENAALHGIGLLPIPGVSGGSVRTSRNIAEELGESSAQRGARASAQATYVPDFDTIPDAGMSTRTVNWRPDGADPNWGLSESHLRKHFFGDDPTYSLRLIDPGGNTDVWVAQLQDLASRPHTTRHRNGVVDVLGTFPRSDGPGVFDLGVRLSPATDGTYDLVTVLTRQSS